MIYLSSSVPNSLVVDDYSRIEELTDERFARDKRAAELGLLAELVLETTDDVTAAVKIEIDAPAGWVRPETVIVRFRHAVDIRADRTVEAARFGDGYVGGVDLAPGRYDVELTDPAKTWRLAGSLSRSHDRLRLAPGSGTAR